MSSLYGNIQLINSTICKLKIFLVLTLFTSTSQAISLEEAMRQVLATNPVVQERLKNYRATVQDLNISKSAYLPKLDLISSVGTAKTKSRVTNFNSEDYLFYENSLVLTQNIFSGFSSSYQVNYQQERIMSAANNYIEKANDISLQLVNVYIQVLLNNELLKTAQENIDNHQEIFQKVNLLYENGQTTLSEVEKIKSSLALAESNFIVQQNNLMDARFSLQRVLGFSPLVESLIQPSLDAPLPKTMLQAANIAIQNNPSILTSSHNINAAQFLRKERQHNNYPQIDFQLSQALNDDSDEYGDLYGGKTNETRASIILSWNLYNGGADQAKVQQQVSTINKEYQIRNDLQRQVIEGTELSWSAYTMLERQITQLNKYRDYSQSTLVYYEEEYDFGRRTLLDLLATQSDFISAKSEIITAQYNRLLAQYRIHDAMGTMVVAILGEDDSYLRKVGLGKENVGIENTQDQLPEPADVPKIDYFTEWQASKKQ